MVINYNAAPTGGSTPLEFCNTVGNPPIMLNFSTDTFESFVPVTTGGSLTLFDVAFIPGDANGNGVLSLTDALSLLGDLFLGQPLPCRRSADFDDNALLESADAIGLLNFLFLGGPPPYAPFPECGFFDNNALSCESPPNCL